MCKYRQTTITFVADSKTYTISGITQPRELPPNSKAIFNAGAADDSVFTFNAAGEPITGGGGTLAISSGGSNEQVTVLNNTGTVSIP